MPTYREIDVKIFSFFASGTGYIIVTIWTSVEVATANVARSFVSAFKTPYNYKFFIVVVIAR